MTDEDVLHRLLFSSINEICKILEEDKAIRASDVDVIARYQGGRVTLRGWAAASRHVRTAEGDTPPWVERSDDIRFAVGLLEQSLSSLGPAEVSPPVRTQPRSRQAPAMPSTRASTSPASKRPQTMQSWT